MSQRAEEAAALPRPQSRAKAKFFGYKPAVKNFKNIFIKGKRWNSFHSEIKCPKSGIFTNNYWVG